MSESGPHPVAGSPARSVGPNTWLAPAVVATLCCFAPTGVVALYFAAQVRLLWERGERTEALACARKARLAVIASIVLWAVFLVILVTTGRAGRLLEAGLI